MKDVIRMTEEVREITINLLFVQCSLSSVFIYLQGGRLVIDTLDEMFCPCNKTTGEWCVLRAMTDIWREMAQEHIISEVNSLTLFIPSKH